MKIPAKGFTHGGKFHADDVFATALLMIVRPDIKVTRGFVVPDGFDGNLMNKQSEGTGYPCKTSKKH